MNLFRTLTVPRAPRMSPRPPRGGVFWAATHVDAYHHEGIWGSLAFPGQYSTLTTRLPLYIIRGEGDSAEGEVMT